MYRDGDNELQQVKLIIKSLARELNLAERKESASQGTKKDYLEVQRSSLHSPLLSLDSHPWVLDHTWCTNIGGWNEINAMDDMRIENKICGGENGIILRKSYPIYPSQNPLGVTKTQTRDPSDGEQLL